MQEWVLTIHSSRSRFAARLNSGVRPRMKLIAALLALTAAGCHPADQVVEGTFVVDGTPRSGIEVRLPTDVNDLADCGKAPLAAITNQTGEFKVVARAFPIRPCFKVNGKIYSDMLIVDDGKRDVIRLRCSLPLRVTGHFEDGHVCY